MKEKAEGNISPCTVVGDRAEPPRARATLPPGTEWWCYRYRRKSPAGEFSFCERTQEQCARTSKYFRSGAFEPLSECVVASEAWAVEIPGQNPMFMIHATEADCRAVFRDECQLVK